MISKKPCLYFPFKIELQPHGENTGTAGHSRGTRKDLLLNHSHQNTFYFDCFPGTVSMSQEEWADATGQAQHGESRQIVGQEGWLRAEAVSRCWQGWSSSRGCLTDHWPSCGWHRDIKHQQSSPALEWHWEKLIAAHSLRRSQWLLHEPSFLLSLC